MIRCTVFYAIQKFYIPITKYDWKKFVFVDKMRYNIG